MFVFLFRPCFGFIFFGLKHFLFIIWDFHAPVDPIHYLTFRHTEGIVQSSPRYTNFWIFLDLIFVFSNTVNIIKRDSLSPTFICTAEGDLIAYHVVLA